MLAAEPRTERAVSILLVLAALAFVGVTIAIALTPGHSALGITVRTEPPAAVERTDIRVDTAIVAQQEPPPPAHTHWHGTCRGGGENWPDMPLTLDVQIASDGTMHATGTLAFVDRKTRIQIAGGLWNDHYRLVGRMTEVGGIDTVWKLELRGRASADRITGTFIEIYPDITPGSARMCTFAFER